MYATKLMPPSVRPSVTTSQKCIICMLEKSNTEEVTVNYAHFKPTDMSSTGSDVNLP